jgi:lipopolysaccharide transport system ATP-binding protein
MSHYAIEAEGIGKRYRLGEDLSRQRLLRTFQAMLPHRRAPDTDELWALRDVSFHIDPGEAIGIIGRNGAGKSTLLKVLSRITLPTEGHARVRGRVGTLLEVGTGFHPELTGRDNIFLSGTILGMSYREVAAKFDEIVAFAEVEKFIDTPVKRYSSGMYVRLAFAVAAFLDPEILIVDEVLAVGDIGFQRKSLGRLNEASSRLGRTVLFVSHNLQAIRNFCRRVLVLDKGKLIFDGPAEKGIELYLRSMPDRINLTDSATQDRLNRASGAVRFTDLSAFDASGRKTWQFQPGDTIRLRFSYMATEDVSDLGFILILSAGDGRDITAIRETLSEHPVARGTKATFELALPKIPLRPCELSMVAILGRIDCLSFYDVVDANVDLPLLFISSDNLDNYERQGLLSLDYRLQMVSAAEPAT